MMDEYITKNNAISAACFGCNQQFPNEPCEPSECTIRQSIMALPAADVVPKSEVERLERLRAELSKEVADLQDALKCEKETNAHLCYEYMSAKTDVARAVIDKFLKAMRIKHEENRLRYGGALALLLPDIEQIGAELKKKYTGVAE